MPEYKESQFTKRSLRKRGFGNWYEAKKGEAHKDLWPLMEALRNEQGSRDESNLLHVSMYSGRKITGLWGDQYAGTQNMSTKVNLADSLVETANSRIANNKVRILYLTEAGNFAQQARAKRMTKIINGTFNEIGFHRHNSEAQRDSCVFDLGAVWFYRKQNSVACERIPGCEIRFDPIDARYGHPTQMFREKVELRSKLLSLYPNKRDAILDAPRSTRLLSKSGSELVSDCVDVVYAWRLKSSDDADDGVFVVSISGADLERSEWLAPFFPVVLHVWSSPIFGVAGKSICEQIRGLQHRVNIVVDDIDDHCELSTGYIAVESGSNFNKDEHTNEVMRVIEFTNTSPQTVMPPAFQQEKLGWLEWLIQRAHFTTGLSELSSSSKKPSGLDSGKALREFRDIESERFGPKAINYEDSYVMAADIVAWLYEEIYESEGDVEVRTYAGGGKVFERIPWERARMDREEYVVRPVPTSFLPTTPSAKLQTIEEMMQAGLLSQQEGMLLLDYPDLEQVTAKRNAPLLSILHRIELMTDPDDPKYIPPEGFMDLNLAINQTWLAYNDAMQAGADVDSEQMENLRRFAEACELKLRPPQPSQTQPTAPMGPPADQAMPAAQPAPAPLALPPGPGGPVLQ